jgi:uncharacterized membrane protein
MFILANQHQAMLILQGILFGTYTVVCGFGRQFSKINENRFLLKFWSLLRGLCVLFAIFLPFSC